MELGPWVLGIDAGATTTTAAIATVTTILGSGQAGSANLHTTSPADIVSHIQQATKQAIKQASKKAHLKSGRYFSSIVVGLAGLDSRQDQTTAERLVKKSLRPWIHNTTQLQVMNDIQIVRHSGSTSPQGVALIAGTGSHAFAINKTGRIASAGGLDYILADEGSAYALGSKVLKAAVQSADGRIKFTLLETAVLKHFKIKAIHDLEPIINHRPFNKAGIANLAKLVETCAAQGDWRAKQIITETIVELTQLVQAVITRTHLQRSNFDIVIVGGVFKISAVPFLSRFKTAVKKIAPHAVVISTDQLPVRGAIRLAQSRLH